VCLGHVYPKRRTAAHSSKLNDGVDWEICRPLEDRNIVFFRITV
jgi:hypothetical protein